MLVIPAMVGCRYSEIYFCIIGRTTCIVLYNSVTIDDTLLQKLQADHDY